MQANNANFLRGMSEEEQTALIAVIQRMLRNMEEAVYSDEKLGKEKEVAHAEN